MSHSHQGQESTTAPWWRFAIIIGVFWGILLWAIIGITGYFRLGSETAALRSGFMGSMPDAWERKIAVRVGWCTTGLVRTGSRFLSLPPEARSALAAFHGGDVGIYRLIRPSSSLDRRAALRAADRAMKTRGWDRIVGVAEAGQLVAVYWPSGKVSAGSVTCCVLVFEGENLIVTSVRGNLEPLFELARQHLDIPELKRRLPQNI